MLAGLGGGVEMIGMYKKFQWITAQTYVWDGILINLLAGTKPLMIPVSAFFISLKAGGVGLNLTDADYVFIIDPWWNPAAELQAEGRAHRIGQDKQVFVYRFITADTIEEKIRNLQESKSELAETFITENDPLKSLTDREWEDLL